jgi:hypothetical protein
MTISLSLTSCLLFAASTLAVPAPQAGGTSVNVAYDTKYDNSSLSTLSVACSDGVNGLFTKGYPTIGALPTFPNVGGSPEIAAWNSPNCGACYQISYNGVTIKVIGVDVAVGSFVLSEAALNTLTGGQAVDLGHVEATYTPVAPSVCGL